MRDRERMALETVVYQQDPFCKDFYNITGASGGCSYGYGHGFEEENIISNPMNKDITQQCSNGLWDWDSHTSFVQNKSYSPSDVLFSEAAAAAPVGRSGQRKRRRTKSLKNKKDVENQRMTHIFVERNRRRQMNDYLAVLRSLMPPSYSQRGDQASIVGGAINFVKELEQILQVLESHKLVKQESDDAYYSLFAKFFSFPQYSTRSNSTISGHDSTAEKPSAIADIEVTMVDTHANIKILSTRRPRQLLKMVSGLHSISLTTLHINVTTVEHMVFYTFSVKVEDDCQLTTVNDIATAVHEMLGMIEDEAMKS